MIIVENNANGEIISVGNGGIIIVRLLNKMRQGYVVSLAAISKFREKKVNGLFMSYIKN